MTNLTTLPGLIDVHTHLRIPGGEHKEDFSTGSAAALRGGVTMILGMPNTSPPLVTTAALDGALEQAKRDARCDIGLFAGASASSLDELPALAEKAAALKIYLNDTFGLLRVDRVGTLLECFKRWPREKLIAMHAEEQSVAVGIALSTTYDRPVHFCHISRREEIELIADAKARGLKVTCEVTPHHLFMDESDARRLGPLGDMRPILGTPDDVKALWERLGDTVDCIATDHAPHTLEEKGSSTPPPGVSGLETSLPLMLTAVDEGRLSLERVIHLMYDSPRRIFGLPLQEDTRVEVEWTPNEIRNDRLRTRCGWTPFHGKRVAAKVKRVILRGVVAYEEDEVVAAPGSGRVI